MYALVENGQVVNVVDQLPSSWKNISGLNLLSDIDILQSLGWYQVSIIDPEYDTTTHTIGGYNYIYDIDTNQVNRVAIIQEVYVPTQEELDQQLLTWRQNKICTNSQFRAALVNANLYTIVENMMNDSNANVLAKIAWEYSTTFCRISLFVDTINTILNLNDEQLDQLFDQAVEINI